MRKLLICFLFILQSPLLLLAQPTGDETEIRKRLIYFTDKADSPFSIDRPEAFLSEKALKRRSNQQLPVTARDLPVNPAYIAAVQQLDVPVWYSTKWFNGVVVACTDEQLTKIQALPFVKNSQSLNREKAGQATKKSGELSAFKVTGSPEAEQEQDENEKELYGLGFHQADMIGAVNLHKDGNKGENMTIAVLDAGFPGVNTAAAFEHLYTNNQITATFDFVAKQANVYHASSHGTFVLSTIAAYLPNRFVGTAYKANFLLLRTEDAASEHNIEEINWLLAAEFADSAGADIINSSLGYTTFHAPSVSYTYQDMDGNTTLVARAADFAAATGMLVVVSAGNDGDKQWRYIASPADADSVLTVGAVDSLGVQAPFSSVGPTSDGRIKPDVVGLGWNAYFLNTAGNIVRGNGTSFSGPIVAGMAACLWQANSSLTNMALMQLLRQSGSNASTPDNNIGYGLPSYSRTTNAPLGKNTDKQVLVSNPVGQHDIILSFGNAWYQQEVQVQVYDVTGKLLYKQQVFADQQKQVLGLQPQQLKQGLYICRLSSPKNRSTVRFLKL
ncbi:S8 family serine peptidase [Pontibacter qinzhouensis]|uniref:S8 family serine peptidase n=1 Tax=Pontibacter qinzhouensis TaxID=2603253 RepID=A0A5C8K961_9BACT|nr:S8 family serine peptidase [Pontibacter qinzhouensis]TXK47660.1 S8 family serine peptidase [Pontibacter qinzhouensis]